MLTDLASTTGIQATQKGPKPLPGNPVVISASDILPGSVFTAKLHIASVNKLRLSR